MRSRHIPFILAVALLLVFVLPHPNHACADPAYQEGLNLLQADLGQQGFTPDELTRISFRTAVFRYIPISWEEQGRV
jgi:hypothetical protein